MFQTSFQNDPFSRAARQPAPLAQPRNSVTVEEVGDGEEFTTRSSRPLVEEPDEGTQYQPEAHARHSHDRESQPRRNHMQQPHFEQSYQESPMYARPARTHDQGQQLAAAIPRIHQQSRSIGSPMVSYSSSSSFVSYGGPGGMSFQRTQSARTGPGGVAEYSESYMDGQRGEGTSHHSRFIGDRGRTAQQSWSSNGRNGNQDILHNLDSQAADGFEQEWAGRSSGRLGSQPYGHRQALRGRMH
ncbi:hypothetical protein WJX74_008273 [Apatococcus lobatus]|uniref:Uncharacterized protein n=1 Tax=Apatococcus lobatus TaxID=904363 RepID=A0AAW1RJQ7_9CHLO